MRTIGDPTIDDPALDETTSYQRDWMTPDEGWPGLHDEYQPPPPSSRLRGVAVGLVAALIAVAIGAGLGATIGIRHTTATPEQGSSSNTPTAPAGPATGAAGVTAGVVDITTTIGYASGQGAGTGFVIASSGRVMTAYHVVDQARTIKIQVGGSGPRYNAAVVGVDVAADVALLQVDGAPALTTVTLGDSSKVSPGDEVVAVGNALGKGRLSSVRGTVVGLDQTVTVSDVDGANTKTLRGLIQTTAPLQPGDSGGPLLDAGGKVIGVDTAASASPDGRFETASSVSFAIPINTAVAVAKRAERGQTDTTVRGARGALLGVQVLSVADAFDQLGYQAPVGAGAVVVGVGSGTPAEDGGLAAGDVIVSIDGTRLGTPESLSSTMLSHKGGDHVRIAWVDPDGRSHSATVRLTAAP